MPVRRVDHRVVSLASQSLQEADEPNGMPECIRLLEWNDMDSGKSSGNGRPPPRKQQIDARTGKRVAQRGGKRNGQESVADAVVGPYDENAPQLVRSRPRAAERKHHRGEPRQKSRDETRRRIEPRVVGHASTASQCASTVSADRSRMQR